MISFANKDIDHEHILKVLDPILPDEYNILVLDFELIKASKIIGESQFYSKFRLNIDNKENIDEFITKLGDKSGTSYNTYKGDKLGKGAKVIVSGRRKCQHSVRRHHLKDAPSHSGPGRQAGNERQPGKNTSCLAMLTFIAA